MHVLTMKFICTLHCLSLFYFQITSSKSIQKQFDEANGMTFDFVDREKLHKIYRNNTHHQAELNETTLE